MKNLTKIGLFALILSFSIAFIACEKEDNSINPDVATEQVEISKSKVTFQNDKANCSINCTLGSCSASGGTASCGCGLLGHPNCTSSGVAMAPTQSSDQQDFVIDLITHIDDNVTPVSVANNITSILTDMQNAIANQDGATYGSGFNDLEMILPDLSDANKAVINTFYTDRDENPVFDL